MQDLLKKKNILFHDELILNALFLGSKIERGHHGPKVIPKKKVTRVRIFPYEISLGLPLLDYNAPFVL